MKKSDPTATASNICLEAKISIISLQCRICYENDKNEHLLAPCNCKGTVAFVHQSCLEKWFAESNTTKCELCHVEFHTERLPKYTPRQSLWRWVRSHRAPRGIARGVRSDIIACTVITPVAIIITYACLYSSDYYTEKKLMLPAARWTSLSLLVMIGIMLLGYYLWVYSVIRMHSRMWYNWWQRDCVVRYVPPSNTQICCHTPAEIINSNNTASTTLLLEVPSAENNESDSVTFVREDESDFGETNSEESEEKTEAEVAIEIPEKEVSDESIAKGTSSEII